MIAPATIARREARGETSERTTLRVAIYTRVSTDEQAALEYNSLRAQEEICKTYIAVREKDPAAQRRWTHAGTYSDAGYSGGTLDRPDLKRLLADVQAGKIDTIIAYKIDRLSRSIAQFYQILHVLDRHGVDFGSATQDFNTGTSQGKLMLNMLLSFAQYERELVSERTRDKIAAARRRGLMSGGTPSLGFDCRDGRLIVNAGEAGLVREIYRIYLERQSLTGTVEELERRGWRTKTWTTKDGTTREGRPFNKVTLSRLLRRPQYAGFVAHRGKLFPGQHEAIVEEAIWSRAQSLLGHNGATGGKEPRNKHHALLRGLIHCARCGSAMTHSFTTKKNGIRYRYYRCVNNGKRGSFACPGGSVPAHEVEQQVLERIRGIGRDPELVAEVVRQAQTQLDERRALLKAERRQLNRDLGHQKAALKRALGAHGTRDIAVERGVVVERLQKVEGSITAIGTEAHAIDALRIDDTDVTRALAQFTDVWDSLWPTERTKILSVLLEGINYDGRQKQLTIRFRTEGIGSLRWGR